MKKTSELTREELLELLRNTQKIGQDLLMLVDGLMLGVDALTVSLKTMREMYADVSVRLKRDAIEALKVYGPRDNAATDALPTLKKDELN